MPNLLRGVNPVTRIALMVIITTPLLLTIDWVSAAVSVALSLVLAPLCGVSIPRLLKMALPLFFIAPLSGISMLLYGREGGEVYFTFWLVTVSENSVQLAIAVMLRVFAVTLPVFILARNIDPTELGDALSQVLHLPSRFVIGAVAGVRMLTLFKDDWDSLARARRARGIADVGRFKHMLTMSFGLLVIALRRGGKLATAMEARGFGRTPPGGGKRTWARESKLHAVDFWALAGGMAVAAIPVAVAVATGAWRFFGL
ncbi:ABC transporter [Corynebacterium phocae]|uniref:ABC transporter n=1 Tax=Corynebacterium phocae TaxID=161895 RepID=A0A1L7D5R3_9CORY|nr:energy-coupling factor transporter transmembrane component T [Corynebacterium phocae]APT93272.1 ABC transporter [Corynebacterium phocae]KAA8721596.1 energy-coupling factor transporter transmembrane protein EcfT [Corynebacterium phocae]